MAFPFGLKSKIFITLAVLLILAMVLIDLVMIATLQKELLRTEIAKGQLVVNTLEQRVLDLDSIQKKLHAATFKGEVVRLQDAVGFTELVILDPTGRVLHFGPLQAPLRPKLQSLAHQALTTKLQGRPFLEPPGACSGSVPNIWPIPHPSIQTELLRRQCVWRCPWTEYISSFARFKESSLFTS